MSESELPNPPELQPDPLLDSDAFIQPEPEEPEPDPNAEEFAPGSVIAAEPISMVAPEEEGTTPAPKPVPARRNPEEMAKRPDWLPEDWTIDLKVRTSGATAGLIDRYYVEPSGQRRFRSKNEVLHFLETGSKLKRKPNSEADAAPSASPQSRKQRKSGMKRRKSAGSSEADPQET